MATTLAPGVSLKFLRHIRAPVTVSDYADVDHVRAPFMMW